LRFLSALAVAPTVRRTPQPFGQIHDSAMIRPCRRAAK
jgi:hypothetical protein